ncbi:MAG TPA: SDR family NAD(P)-dependent oxidoreductase [Acidimicrobiia bacterium]|jgi:NAD(P)-dependent dehydrogenase (short-subunit alcohol dehydrogenase family)
MLRLDDRVAIVTGAGGGVGRAHALALAERGARVVVNDLGIALDGSAPSSEVAQRVVGEIVQAGGTAVADAHSVAEPDGARAIVQTALDAYGGIDILVNNAGVLDDQLLANVDDAYVDRVLDTHLLGAVSLCRAVWAPMAEQGRGRIVNTSSGAVFGSAGGTVYQTAKAGLIGLTRSLALAGADLGIQVNAIMPTAYTRMTATVPDETFRAFMEQTFGPERVAAFVVVLASDDAPVTGECFLVGGGRIARAFLGVTAGYISDDPSPEDFAAHLDDVMDTDGMFVPVDRASEFNSYLGDLGFGGGLDLKKLSAKND